MLFSASNELQKQKKLLKNKKSFWKTKKESIKELFKRNKEGKIYFEKFIWYLKIKIEDNF